MNNNKLRIVWILILTVLGFLAARSWFKFDVLTIVVRDVTFEISMGGGRLSLGLVQGRFFRDAVFGGDLEDADKRLKDWFALQFGEQAGLHPSVKYIRIGLFWLTLILFLPVIIQSANGEKIKINKNSSPEK